MIFSRIFALPYRAQINLFHWVSAFGGSVQGAGSRGPETGRRGAERQGVGKRRADRAWEPKDRELEGGQPESRKAFAARGGIAVGAPHGRTDTAGMLDAEIKNMLQP